jgi:hypothetical protein
MNPLVDNIDLFDIIFILLVIVVLLFRVLVSRLQSTNLLDCAFLNLWFSLRSGHFLTLPLQEIVKFVVDIMLAD